MSALSQEEAWLSVAVGSKVHDFYQAIGVDLPQHGGAEAMVSCFSNPAEHKHGDRNKSCSVNLLSALWKCHACGDQGNAYKAALARGYSEQAAKEMAQRFGLFLEVVREKPRLPNEKQIREYKEALMNLPRFLTRLYELKGWTREALWRCSVGWDGERLTFPIRDHKLRRVGLVRYLPGGTPKSKALPGSKRLLFPAPEVLTRRRPVFLVEGEPDAVSVFSCGHQAVAVPGTGSWRPEFAQRLGGFRVVILADCDPQGRELARRITEVMPRAKVVDLDPSAQDGSDVGDLVSEASKEPGGLQVMHRMLERLAA